VECCETKGATLTSSFTVCSRRERLLTYAIEATELVRAHRTPRPAARSTISLTAALRGSTQSQVKLGTIPVSVAGAKL